MFCSDCMSTIVGGILHYMFDPYIIMHMISYHSTCSDYLQRYQSSNFSRPGSFSRRRFQLHVLVLISETNTGTAWTVFGWAVVICVFGQRHLDCLLINMMFEWEKVRWHDRTPKVSSENAKNQKGTSSKRHTFTTQLDHGRLAKCCCLNCPTAIVVCSMQSGMIRMYELNQIILAGTKKKAHQRKCKSCRMLQIPMLSAFFHLLELGAWKSCWG